MAQPAPAPQATPDATVNVDSSGTLTISPNPLTVPKGGSKTILFTYQGNYAECLIKIEFQGWGSGPVANGGMVSVGS